MNLSKKILLFIIIYLSINTTVQSQNLHISFINGVSSSYPMNEIKKIKFESDELILELNDGSIYSWNVSIIGNTTYDESGSLSLESNEKNNYYNILVFPNPTADDVVVKFKIVQSDRISFYLLNSTGIKYEFQEFECFEPGEHIKNLNLNGLSNGVYSLIFQGTNYQVAKRLTIHK
jgi:hypothetical protein